VNHSWHATLYPTARGFTTGLVPDEPGGIELSLDLICCPMMRSGVPMTLKQRS
jgi:uncharacterized protein DUF5996